MPRCSHILAIQKIWLSLCICGGQRVLSYYCSCLAAQGASEPHQTHRVAECAPFLFSGCMWGIFCCHPACLDGTQSWLGPPSSSIQTWLGALHITGQDGRDWNRGGDGQQWAGPPLYPPPCPNLVMSQIKTFPGWCSHPCLV